MKKYTVIPGEVEVIAETWMIDESGTLEFFNEQDELITMWAKDRWHRVEVGPVE